MPNGVGCTCLFVWVLVEPLSRIGYRPTLLYNLILTAFGSEQTKLFYNEKN